MNPEFSAPSTDIVYTDAEVLSGGGAAPATEAIWLRDGRVAAVGSNEAVLAQAGRKVPRQSLNGATVVPGLIDTHPHLLHFAGFLASMVNILEATDHDDILSAIRGAAVNTPQGQWLLTTPVGEPHYFHRRSWRDLKEGALPDRHVLDRATTDHPVMILAWAPITPNVCALNTAALSALGLDANTPDRVENVWIEKDAHGTPTGLLRGNVNCYYNSDPFFLRLLAAMPPPIKPAAVAGGVCEAMASYNARGITTIYEGHMMEPEHIGVYQALRQQGLLTLRVQAAPELECSALPTDRPKTAEQARATLQAALAMRTRADDWMRIDGITASVWGPCYGGYLYWREGYRDAWGGRTTGRRMVSEENTRLAFEFCAEHGLRLNLSSMSPDEHDQHLAMTAETMTKHRLDRTGWLVQHGCMLRD
ncbi:MAG: amidohydrolase family protein, partial [Rhodospirillales bacterium]|nr:amidohydrolase family protein [Acetobacter sp.]